MDDNKLALVEESELSLVGTNALNAKQLQLILQKTPAQYIRKRPAKGGGQWEYVTGGYMKKVLNLMFGWLWSFEIIDEKILFGEVIVKGKLTCTSNGATIVKMQYGNKDIIYKKEPDKDGNKIPLSIGNDMKAAATDALKKCAAEIGIAADIYNKDDFREVQIADSIIDKDELTVLFDLKKESLTPSEIKDAERIIKNEEENSYRKLHNKLKSK